MYNSLNDFIKARGNNKIVVVQGLGFVGSVMSLVCANALNEEYSVIGVDLPNKRGLSLIENLNNGVFPLIAEDPKISEYFQESIRKGNFYATSNIDSYKYADVIIIDINLDVDKQNTFFGQLSNYSVDLDPFVNAIKTIGDNCKENCVILVETTVPPGTCKEVVVPIIYDCLNNRNLSCNQIKIGHSYERVMPGPNYIDSIQNFYRVYSGINEESAIAIEKFLKSIIHVDKYPLTKLDNTNATEMAKVMENSFRALNIAFIIEWSRFAEESEVNLYEVIDAIRLRPTHSNMMYPGVGVGGYCLTKDALLASWARQNLLSKKGPLKQSENAINMNDQMPKFAFDYLYNYYPNLSKAKVLILGISYRGDVGDTRNSPAELLYNYLSDAGASLTCHDPYINFWEEKSLDIETDIYKHLNVSPDILILCTGHSIYKDDRIVDSLLNLKRMFIYDTIGLLTNDQIDKLLNKHTVKVLGRGDL
tara:strand:+ start:3902 stop:5332 length:1431 start_codon:yes stop_codon:yes gene_type:complete